MINLRNDAPYASQALLDYIHRNDGKVSADVAHRFLNKILYGAYKEDDLNGITDEMKVSLYEAVAVAKYDSPRFQAGYKNPSLASLDVLNRSLGRLRAC